MAKVSLSISGVSEGMSSKEVCEKLAQLYGKPEQHFEKLCKSLFIMQQPFVLLKNVEQNVAEKHEKRLTALGFTCDFGDGALSLVPTATTAFAAANCPACEQPCGDGEACQQCGTHMAKFLKQKEIDEKLQKQLQSACNSHERIQKFQAEQSAQQKQQARARQKEKLEKKQKKAQEEQQGNDAEPEESVTESIEDVSDFKAVYQEKRNYAMYAALASAVLVVGGGGYVAHDKISNRYVSDAPQQVASAPAEQGPLSGDESIPVASANETASVNATIIEEPLEVEPTIFEKWSARKRNNGNFRNQIQKLVDEDMLASATGLVAGKTDPRDQVFGRQELIKIEGQSNETDRKMLNSYMLVLALEGEADRVAATLNQSSVYRKLDRQEDAVKTYDQAARIANGIADPKRRIVSETAIAEHHIEYGNLEGARARYLAAKDFTAKLTDPKLKVSALDYIATSEAERGLTADAETTAEQIADSAVREQLLGKITESAANKKVNGVPELAASLKGEEGTGDELIDDLIKINEANKKKIQAAGTLLGQ